MSSNKPTGFLTDINSKLNVATSKIEAENEQNWLKIKLLMSYMPVNSSNSTKNSLDDFKQDFQILQEITANRKN